jgi:hypothetical protein
VTPYRGRALAVRAIAKDDESGIREATFYAARPLPDGTIPPAAAFVKVEKPTRPQPAAGKAAKKEKEPEYWAADLEVPADQQGRFYVTVRFVNNVGLSATSAPLAVEVKDVPVTPAAKASIAGVVREGGRAQPKVTVVLLNANRQALLQTTTAPDGSYLFKDLDPGTYRVSARYAPLNLRGETDPIPLQAMEQKTGQDISLVR